MGIVNAKAGLGRMRARRGMGTVSTMVGNSLVYGSSPTYGSARAPIIRSGWGRGIPPGVVMWGPSPPVSVTQNYPPAWLTAGPSGIAAPAPGNLTLAQLQNLLNTNPGSLTPAQWQTLQAAGMVSGTVPYSSAGQVAPTGGAIDPTTGQPYASELAAAQAAGASAAAPVASTIFGTDPVSGATTILGIDWYYLAGAAVLVYMFTGRRGR